MQSVTPEENQTQNGLLKIHENSISLYCLTWSLNETYWLKKNNPTSTSHSPLFKKKKKEKKRKKRKKDLEERKRNSSVYIHR